MYIIPKNVERSVDILLTVSIQQYVVHRTRLSFQFRFLFTNLRLNRVLIQMVQYGYIVLYYLNAITFVN